MKRLFFLCILFLSNVNAARFIHVKKRSASLSSYGVTKYDVNGIDLVAFCNNRGIQLRPWVRYATMIRSRDLIQYTLRCSKKLAKKFRGFAQTVAFDETSSFSLQMQYANSLGFNNTISDDRDVIMTDINDKEIHTIQQLFERIAHLFTNYMFVNAREILKDKRKIGEFWVSFYQDSQGKFRLE